jgi:hypothetical protein
MKIRDLESYENSQGREKDLGKNIGLIYSICEEAGCCLVCWGKDDWFSYFYEHYGLSVRKGETTETERHF